MTASTDSSAPPAWRALAALLPGPRPDFRYVNIAGWLGWVGLTLVLACLGTGLLLVSRTFRLAGLVSHASQPNAALYVSDLLAAFALAVASAHVFVLFMRRKRAFTGWLMAYATLFVVGFGAREVSQTTAACADAGSCTAALAGVLTGDPVTLLALAVVVAVGTAFRSTERARHTLVR